MGFTCVACRCIFDSVVAQKEHYRSDWHRYNLKRKVAGVGPMSLELFTEKREAALRAARAGQRQEFHGKCETCRKTFSSANAYKQHLGSKKHREKAAKAARKRTASMASDASGVEETKAPPAAKKVPAPATAPSGIAPGGEPDVDMRRAPAPAAAAATAPATAAPEEPAKPTAGGAGAGAGAGAEDSADSDAEVELNVNQCLFCSKISGSIESALKHMHAEHSFSIPDTEYLTDRTGLLAYLHGKVRVGHVCLFCLRQFSGAFAVQNHMTDKAHCRLCYDEDKDMVEYEDFYDFSASYPVGSRSAPSGAVAAAGDAEGDATGEDGDDEAFLRDASRGVELLPSGELLLPDGRVIGHRMYRQIYRQALPSEESVSMRINRRLLHDKEAEQRVALRSGRAASAITVMSSKPRAKEYKKQQKHEYRRQQKQRIGTSTRANKLQTYFRDQVMF